LALKKGTLYNNDPQVLKMIEESKNVAQIDIMKRLMQFNRKEIIEEVCLEFENRGHFIRIFPNSTSNFYDQFFSGPRPMN
jgi:hypothetical protein